MTKNMKTIDGNAAVAHVAYAMSEVAAIYPITPSSPIGEICDEWSTNNKKNVFGEKLLIRQLQSEAGAAAAVHGSLAAGSLTSTYTASQGLLLMIPNMYKISGELLPGVFHVTARAIAAHALSIFGDHQDIMAVRQTGFAILISASVQESMDLALIAHLAALESSIPFLHSLDGFRTSHEIQKIEIINYDDMKKMINFKALSKFRSKSVSPCSPYLRGTAQNPDIYFQGREASNIYYLNVPNIVAKYMTELYKITNRKYKLFDYVGITNAKHIIIAMGSSCEAIEEVVNCLNNNGNAVGLIKVRLFRPFSSKHLFNILPKTVSKITVLDRTKEPGSIGEPLYQDICTAFTEYEKNPIIIGGRYGLGSKEFTPSMIKAIFDNMNSDKPKNHFTIGINDDITYTHLEIKNDFTIPQKETVQCKFWGLGADGTVGANKSAIKIIGDNTKLYAQGYFAYDSKKSGGVTISHLRFGKNPIQSTYLINNADYIACHNCAYVNLYEILDDIKDGGTFMLNSPWTIEDMSKHLPAKMRKTIAQKKLIFYNIDAVKIANSVGLGGRINMIMQVAFFKASDVIPIKNAISYLKDQIKKNFGKKGKNIVKMNIDAVDIALSKLVKIEYPKNWIDTCKLEKSKKNNDSTWVSEVMLPILAQQGDKLPVSSFSPDGIFPVGTTKFEKRAVAINVPKWISGNCIQCNHCSMVCPHAAIRPVLLTKNMLDNAPTKNMKVIDAIGKEFKNHKFRIQIFVEDCMGCGNCVDTCPSKNKALVMLPIATQLETQIQNQRFISSLPILGEKIAKRYSVKGSQFFQPLLEFSGACSGCGETPYAKLLTQLFGERMVIGNATGCSSIWGGSAPSIPYCTNSNGYGPSWGNSLFEDPAEFTYGMYLGALQQRKTLITLIKQAIKLEINSKLKNIMHEWLKNTDNYENSKYYGDKIHNILKDDSKNPILKKIYNLSKYLEKYSYWVFVGDGAAYDISFGGIDHIMSTGENINIIVFDTEMYSNTGGQSSKATPTGSIAKFAASGKKTPKKDLGGMAMTYNYVYIASVGMGADKKQLVKAFTEAENYNGPSLIMAYAPCISHGIKKGMGKTQKEIKRAVSSGYWPLYRYNPTLRKKGITPFILDSKKPNGKIRNFIDGEIRFTALKNIFPNEAVDLHDKLEIEVLEKYAALEQMSKNKLTIIDNKMNDDTKLLSKLSESKLEQCTLTETAEHSGRIGSGKACDDGRAGGDL